MKETWSLKDIAATMCLQRRLLPRLIPAMRTVVLNQLLHDTRRFIHLDSRQLPI